MSKEKVKSENVPGINKVIGTSKLKYAGAVGRVVERKQ